MAINLRELIIRDYESIFSELPACVVVDHSGYTAEETKMMRKSFHDQGIGVSVVRNKLARLAFHKSGVDVIGKILSGPVTLVYGSDSIEVSKAVVEWNKTHRPLPIKGGYIEDAKNVLTDKDVLDLAKLPDIKTMQALLLGTIIAPIRNIANCFQASLASFVQCVNAHIEKMEKESGEPAVEAEPAATS